MQINDKADFSKLFTNSILNVMQSLSICLYTMPSASDFNLCESRLH